MREILFRGKRLDNVEWVYGNYTHAQGTSKMLIDRTSWHSDEWVYEDVSINNHLICEFMPPTNQGWDYGGQIKFHKVDPATLGQFTGLTDKHGVYIFEGDVVIIGNHASFGWVTNQDGEIVEYKVLYKAPDFVLYREDIRLQWGRLSRLNEMNWDCGVIGNIHDK